MENSITDRLFMLATKNNTLFSTQRGTLSIQDMWKLPLTTGTVNLNDIAISFQKELREMEDTGLVKTKKDNPKRANVEFKLKLVTAIFEYRTEEAEAKAQAEADKAHNAKIDEIIEEKQDEKLKKSSIKDLKSQKR